MAKIILCFLSVFILNSRVCARSFKLVELTNDWDHKKYELYLETSEDGAFSHLELKDLSLNDWTQYFLDELRSGVVLKEVQGQKIIILQSHNINVLDGGTISVSYLKNIFTGEYKKLSVEIDHNNQEWFVFYKGKRAKAFHFITNRVVNKAIGIKKVVVQLF